MCEWVKSNILCFYVSVYFDLVTFCNRKSCVSPARHSAFSDAEVVCLFSCLKFVVDKCCFSLINRVCCDLPMI
jgi:hypothetical protein